MSLYRLSIKHGSATNKGKATKHCDYIHAKNEYSYKAKEIAYQRELMPEWVTSSSEFFKYSEEKESINGQTYKEFEIALVNDISLEENINLLNKFLDKELQNKYYFTAVIHNKEVNHKNNETIKNIHAHVMFSTRELDGIKRDENTFFKRANKKFKERGGAAKNEKWNSTNKTTIYNIRKSWEEEINLVLEKHNLEKVSCESLATQRQEALLKGDINAYNKLNRKPLNCDINIINKVRKNIPLTKKEKTEYQNYTKTLKEKNILDEIYSIELQKQKLLKEQENIKNINNQKEILHKENHSYSYENIKQKYKNMIEVEKYLMQSKIELEKLNNDKNNLQNLAIFNLYPEYKNLFEEQQFYLDKLTSDLSDEKYDEYIKKLTECESKLDKIILTFDEKLIENEKNNIKAKIELEELSIKSDISYLGKYKNTFYEELSIKDKDLFSNTVLEQNFYNNMNTLVFNMYQFDYCKKEIEKINNQLTDDKLKDITVNIITKGESRKLINKIKKSTNEKNKLEDTLRTTRFTGDELLQKQKQLESLNMRIQNLTSQYDKLLKELATPENKLKTIKISSSIEKKLLNKKNKLLSDRHLYKQNIKLYRTQTFDTVKNKEQLTILQKHYKTNAAINEKNIEQYNIVLNNLKNLKTQENLQQLAYNKITNGRFYKLLSEYNTAKNELEKNKNSLKNLGTFNFKEKKNLNTNIEKLSQDCSTLQKEYLNIINTTSTENLSKIISDLETVYDTAEKNIKEKISDENNNKFENIMKAKYVKDIKNELYPFTPNFYLEKVNLVNSQELGLDDEGYSSNIFGTDNKNHKKKKSLDLTL